MGGHYSLMGDTIFTGEYCLWGHHQWIISRGHFRGRGLGTIEAVWHRSLRNPHRLSLLSIASCGARDVNLKGGTGTVVANWTHSAGGCITRGIRTLGEIEENSVTRLLQLTVVQVCKVYCKHAENSSNRLRYHSQLVRSYTVSHLHTHVHTHTPLHMVHFHVHQCTGIATQQDKANTQMKPQEHTCQEDKQSP